MCICILKSSCCGCSLKTGSKIIGWLSMLASVVTLIVFGLSLAGLYYIEENPDKVTPKTKKIYDNSPILKAGFIMIIMFYIVEFGSSFILLMGVYQEKAKLILVWVRVSFTCSTLLLHLAIIECIILYQPIDAAATIGWFLRELYFILVVYSFYREIQNVNDCDCV